MKVPAPAPLLLATWGGISEGVSDLGWGGAGLSPLLSPYPGAAGEPPHPHHRHHGQARAQPKNASPPRMVGSCTQPRALQAPTASMGTLSLPGCRSWWRS